ncbi:hypothetical protein BKA62DRAFT_663412 [Auriculariales sp. MPI-PUGE-AT-0066]|nr:hypothetical protein BKA62DRAFT_663412 [Auriculariales sp. MPI-PUGE-AT-0066]
MRFSKALAFATFAGSTYVAKAQLLDVCANVNVDLFALLGLINLGGLVNVCLCLSALPVFVDTNIVAKLVVALTSRDAVLDALTDLLNKGKGSQQCTYPPHCTPSCTNADPCGWECPKPWVKKDGKCVCPAPYYECDGKCTDKPCPSGYPTKAKRDMYALESICAPGETLCGIWSGFGKNGAWECLNTQRNLESCGGCVTPLPGQRASGRDCTAIPGVANVECVYGDCVVSKCKRGWKVNADTNGCFEAKYQGISEPEVFVVNNHRD